MDWSPKDVVQWMQSLGYEYDTVQKFFKNDICWKILNVFHAKHVTIMPKDFQLSEDLGLFQCELSHCDICSFCLAFSKGCRTFFCVWMVLHGTRVVIAVAGRWCWMLLWFFMPCLTSTKMVTHCVEYILVSVHLSSSIFLFLVHLLDPQELLVKPMVWWPP